MSDIDADGHRSDVLATLAEALAGPLSAGAQGERIEIGEDGRLVLPAGVREPLLLLAPAGDMGGEPAIVTVRIGADALPPLTFAPWTEARSFLPFHRPAVGAGGTTLAAVEYLIGARFGNASLPSGELRNRLEVRLLSGRFGRLYYLLAAETLRIRRTMRQVARVRRLDGAAGAMLDRIGAELAVPRFSDRLAVAGGQIVTAEAAEDDAAYRRRLRLYRPFTMPTRAKVDAVLNGDPAAGPRRFEILEEDNRFHIALRLVSVAATEAEAQHRRRNYQAYLRETVLVDPTADVPGARLMSSARRRDENRRRRRLRDFLNFGGPSRFLAPALAAAFDRAATAVAAVGHDLRLNVVRAQEDDGGSRWELGLAAEIETPAMAALQSLASRVRGADVASIADPAARSLVARLKSGLPEAGPPAEDWLFRAMGFRTVHRLAPNRVMLSHFSTEGLLVSGRGDLPQADARDVPFTASLLAADDDAMNATLAYALSGGDSRFPGGAPPWQAVGEGTRAAEIAALQLPPAGFVNRLRSLGLGTNFPIEQFREALARYPTGLFALLRLRPQFADALAADQQGEWERFGALLEQLARTGVASAVLLRGREGRLILIVSAIALPALPSNLASRRTTGFVWRALPVTNGSYRVTGSGTRASFGSDGAGISALAVIGYSRRGLTDPFEYRITAAEGVTLDISEYEYLMNALRQLTPAGVQANTWDVRRRSIVIDPAAGPQALPIGLTRAFRPYRRPRFTGAASLPLPPAS